jgi:hypothetical protein
MWSFAFVDSRQCEIIARKKRVLLSTAVLILGQPAAFHSGLKYSACCYIVFPYILIRAVILYSVENKALLTIVKLDDLHLE